MFNGGTVLTRSMGLYHETEKPGLPVPEEVVKIISLRYRLAREAAMGARVLEVGCGAGLGVRAMLGAGKAYIAGEYADENLAFLRQRWGARLPLVRLDAHALPFEAAVFDTVVALAMVYYLDTPRFLAECKRVLRSGGRLFLCSSNPDVPGFVPAPYTKGYYSVPEMATLLSEAGFTSTFRGAFPAAGGPLPIRCLRAAVKTVVKGSVSLIPGGRDIWRRMRSQALGPHVELPGDVDPDLSIQVPVEEIDARRTDRCHRVYYVDARKESR